MRSFAFLTGNPENTHNYNIIGTINVSISCMQVATKMECLVVAPFLKDGVVYGNKLSEVAIYVSLISQGRNVLMN